MADQAEVVWQLLTWSWPLRRAVVLRHIDILSKTTFFSEGLNHPLVGFIPEIYLKISLTKSQNLSLNSSLAYPKDLFPQ